MNYKFPLATSTWDKSEIDALQRVISSNRYSMGEEVKQFERDFANIFDSNYAVMVNSGSSANLIMTAALFFTSNEKIKLKANDEILVPAVSWSTTYYPLSQYGLNLRFVDIDIDTLNYDLKALENAITKKTKAIMVVNLLGNPNDFSKILNLAEQYNLVVIEDNCESMGASFNNKKTGTFGVMGSFSCFFSHHISTMEGGVVLTDDEELYHIMLSLRAHGWTRDLPRLNKLTGQKSQNHFEESFNFILPGYNLRPLEMSGAVGKEQLKKLPSLIEGRQKNGNKFLSSMENNENFIVQKELGKSSWFGFSLVIKPGRKFCRADLVNTLNKLGFESRPIVAGNFANNPVMKHFKYSISGGLKNADYIDKNGLFIGNHHYPIDDAIEVLSQIDSDSIVKYV